MARSKHDETQAKHFRPKPAEPSEEPARTHAREDKADRKALAQQAHSFTIALAAKVQHWRCSRESAEAKSATLATIALSCSNRGWTVEETAEFVGCAEIDVREALAKGLKAIARIEVMEASAYRQKVAGKLESIDAQLQALADQAVEAGAVDVAIRALESRRKTAGDLSTLYGANASKQAEDAADAIADLLARTANHLSEADRTANEPALHLIAAGNDQNPDGSQ